MQKFVLRKGVFRHFCILCFFDHTKVEKNQKNMRTTIIDVKFDVETKSELRIGLPFKENPEKAENFRKIIKLLVEKKRCEKIPSAPIIIRKNIKKGNFWHLVDVPKPASVSVITVFLFSVFFLISRLYQYE